MASPMPSANNYGLAANMRGFRTELCAACVTYL